MDNNESYPCPDERYKPSKGVRWDTNVSVDKTRKYGLDEVNVFDEIYNEVVKYIEDMDEYFSIEVFLSKFDRKPSPPKPPKSRIRY